VVDTVVRTLRNTVGLTVELPRDWFVDASFTYGESDGTEVINNSINRDRLQYFWGKLDFEFNASYIYNFQLNQFLGAKANGKPEFSILDQEDSYGIPDFKAIASLFYSKTLFGIDTFRTGLTLNFIDSEHDINEQL
jgi:hypothetical protein